MWLSHETPRGQYAYSAVSGLHAWWLGLQPEDDDINLWHGDLRCIPVVEEIELCNSVETIQYIDICGTSR